MRKTLGLLCVTLLLLGVSSCGSSDGGLCQQVGKAVCAKACSCREGPSCALSQGAVTFGFEGESDCEVFLVTVACSKGDKAAYNDAAACQALVQAGTCTGTGTEAAFSYPPDDACRSPESN